MRRRCLYCLVLTLLVCVGAWPVLAQQLEGPQLLHNASTTNSTGVQQRVRGMTAVSNQVIVAGGFDGTITFETSQDEVIYVAILCRNATTQAVAATATVSGRYVCNLAGSERFQARISGRTVGSATVIAQFSGAMPPGDFGQGMLAGSSALTDVNLKQVGGTTVVTGGVAGSLGVGGLAADGAAVAGNALRIAGKDGGGLTQDVLTDTAGRIEVNPISGQTGVQGGAGGVTAVTQRVAVATDANTVNTELPAAAALADAQALPSAPTMGSVLLPYNGTTTDIARSASVSNFPVSSTLTARNSLGAALTEKGARWSVVSNASPGVQATASIAAEVGVRHVGDVLCMGAVSTTAPVLTTLIVALRDGASGAGTILWVMRVVVSAGVGTQVAPFCTPSLQLVGTTNTALTLEFSAGVANVIQSVSLTGFNVN